MVEIVPFPEAPSFSLQVRKNSNKTWQHCGINERVARFQISVSVLQVGDVSETRSEDDDDQDDPKAESESVSGSDGGSGATSTPSTRSPSRGTASTVEELYRYGPGKPIAIRSSALYCTEKCILVGGIPNEIVEIDRTRTSN